MRQRGETGHEQACYEARSLKAHGDLHLGVRSYYFFAATAITPPRVHQQHGCDGRDWHPVLTAAGLGRSAVEFKELGHGLFNVRAHGLALSRRFQRRWHDLTF